MSGRPSRRAAGRPCGVGPGLAPSGRRVEEVKLPKGATIGAIVRGQDVIMGHHDTVIEADDHVIVFLTERRHIEAVERLFQD